MKWLLPLILWTTGYCQVLVMTHAFNRPEFIAWQKKGLDRFLEDDFQFVVFNDAATDAMCERIESACRSLDIECIRVPQSIHRPPYYHPRENGLGGPSVECGETIQYMLNTLGFSHNDHVILLDSDMFLVRPLHIKEMMQGYHIAATPQYRQGKHQLVEYLLPNLLIFDMPRLPRKDHFNCNMGTIDGVLVDSAGFTHYYLKSTPELNWLKIDDIHKPLKWPEESHHLTNADQFESNTMLLNAAIEMAYDYEFYYGYHFLTFEQAQIGITKAANRCAKRPIICKR